MERCARCGAEFGCDAGTGSCWCQDVELPAAATAAARAFGDTCLCPACLKACVDEQDSVASHEP